MEEYVDRGEAGGFGEFPPLVGTAYEFDRGMKTSLIFTGRVINWPDIPVLSVIFLLSVLSLPLSPSLSSFSNCLGSRLCLPWFPTTLG